MEDFEILYSEVDANALTTSWPQIHKKPHEVYKIELDKNIPFYHIQQERHDFLTYLMAVPTNRTKFENAVKSMFIFEDVS